MSRQVYLCRGVKKIFPGFPVLIRERFVVDFEGLRVVRRHAGALLCLMMFSEVKVSVSAILTSFPATSDRPVPVFRFRTHCPATQYQPVPLQAVYHRFEEFFARRVQFIVGVGMVRWGNYESGG